MRFGHRGATGFDYRQRGKDVPTFHSSMNVKDFLDWMSELDTFFKFYEIPMDNRVNLVAYKLKGGAQSWEDDYNEEEHEERFDEEIETDICHTAEDDLDGDFYADGEYSAKSCVVRRIMLAPKLIEKSH
ncbi:hypothetical protein Tco_1423710 [Tanacetum coccineum]